MGGPFKSAIMRTLTGGLHRLEFQITKDRHKQGGSQRLLDRTWFDPQVRPFSVDVVQRLVAQHGFSTSRIPGQRGVGLPQADGGLLGL
ncbi:MAG: hypothetical protein HYS14_11950 [Candidatus Rokubacteria bacterium]|nr:hypothetical protein [Candidatus Rokubacteria bacterium]